MIIVGLDLSKSSTGVSILDNGKRIETHTISLPNQSKHTKSYHLPKQEILNSLARLIGPLRPRDTLVVMESSVFGRSASELCFYLYQSVLEHLHALDLNTIALTPTQLKSFALALADPNKKYPTPTKVEKQHITQIIQEYPTHNPTILDVTKLEGFNPKNDDEYDAILLSLFGHLISPSINHTLKTIPNAMSVAKDLDIFANSLDSFLAEDLQETPERVFKFIAEWNRPTPKKKSKPQISPLNPKHKLCNLFFVEYLLNGFFQYEISEVNISQVASVFGTIPRHLADQIKKQAKIRNNTQGYFLSSV